MTQHKSSWNLPLPFVLRLKKDRANHFGLFEWFPELRVNQNVSISISFSIGEHSKAEHWEDKWSILPPPATHFGPPQRDKNKKSKNENKSCYIERERARRLARIPVNKHLAYKIYLFLFYFVKLQLSEKC